MAVEEGRCCGYGRDGCYARRIRRIGPYRLCISKLIVPDPNRGELMRRTAEGVRLNCLPGSPEWAMRRWVPRTLILSTLVCILTIDREAAMSAATIT